MSGSRRFVVVAGVLPVTEAAGRVDCGPAQAPQDVQVCLFSLSLSHIAHTDTH